MGHYVVSTGTITYAIKGRDLLRSLGFKAHVERRLSGDGSKGCGYVIVLSGDLKKAKTALENAGIKILGITGEGQS